MNKVKKIIKKYIFYLTLPEMRIFWFLFVLVFFLGWINFIYMPAHFKAIILITILLALILVFFDSFRVAKLNWEEYVKKNQIKDIIANLSDGLIYYDPDFKVEIFNPAAERIFGIRANEIIGKYLSPSLIQKRKFKLLVQTIFPSLAPLLRQISPDNVWPQVVKVTFKEKEFLVITSRVSDAKGKILGFFKIIQDRSREKELSNSKEMFITVAAHQLRSPLTGIKWALEELGNYPNLNQEQKSIIEESNNNINKLLKITEDLLMVSKIEEGKFGYNFEEVDLNSFIEDNLKSALAMAKKEKINLYFDRMKEDIKVKIDKSKLSIVFFNLLDNAIRYNSEGGRIIVKAFKEADKPFVKISISDSGIGIPANEIDKVFTKFFRASNALSIKAEGTGLGLFISKNIIKNHGGDIWVESEINRGTTFYFTLPTDPSLIPLKEMEYE